MINRLVLVAVACTYLGSCHSLDRVQSDDSRVNSTVIEPIIPDPPELTAYIAQFGESEGSRLYIKKLKNYVTYVSMYIKHVSLEYNVPYVEKDVCVGDTEYLKIPFPYMERLNDADPNNIIQRLTDYIERLTETIDDYNTQLVTKQQAYLDCIK